MSEPLASARKPSVLRSIKMVAWSFVGIRKGSELQEDVARVSPFQVIAVGIAGVVVLVLSLILLVHWVVAK